MKRRLAVLLFAAFGLTTRALAQSSSDSATIQALLAEVRQLRLALERSAALAPRIQLTLQRAQLQQDQVARLSRQLEDLRDRMAQAASEETQTLAQIKAAEAHVVQEQDAARRKTIEEEIKAVKARLEQQSEQQRIQQAQQQARESELAGRLETERSKLNELNEKLNALERMLDGPPKQP
jgi:chromosome segregation ATPase